MFKNDIDKKWNVISEAEKIVCRKILNKPIMLLEKSEWYLEKYLFISRSSFNRLIKKLGYDSVSEFRRTILKEAFYDKNNENEFTMNINFSIQQTLLQIDDITTSKLFRILFKSKNISIFGEGINTHVAKIIAKSLRKLNIFATPVSDADEIIHEGENNLLIVISFSSKGKTVKNVILDAKKHMSKVLLISNSNIYKEKVDLFLQIISSTNDKNLEREMQFFSKYVVLSIFDFLIQKLFIEDKINWTKKIKSKDKYL